MAPGLPATSPDRTASVQAAADRDPDALYRSRDDLAKAREAEAVWQRRLERRGADFESAWKVARARYWIGTHVAEGERETVLGRGIRAAEHAMRLEPDRPEGHFWLAANLGALAEAGGPLRGLRYRGRIRSALERVLAIDPAWQQGSADRALGRWYFKVPGLFGGSNAEAERHLRQSLTYNPDSTASLVFLAEVLLDDGRESEAAELLKRTLAAPLDPEWAPEDREFKAQARRLLENIGGRRSP
jgi:tetratricopeptide (TPR) repeat protein